jgi:hypothetical protein
MVTRAVMVMVVVAVAVLVARVVSRAVARGVTRVVTMAVVGGSSFLKINKSSLGGPAHSVPPFIYF